MFIPQSARQHSGVAYREEADRGDNLESGGGAEDEAAKAAAAAEKVATEAAEKAAAEKTAREASMTIPKSRFDEAVAKERVAREAAEKRVAEFEAKSKKEAAGADVAKLRTEIDALEDQLEAKMTEGTPAERKMIRAQIREKQEVLSDAKASAKATMATALAIEQMRYDGAVEKLEGEYPFLVAGSEDFNQTITGEVLELKAAYEASGLASSEAIKKAVKVLEPSLKAAKEALKKVDPAAAKVAEEAAKKAAEEAAEKAKTKIDEETERKRREEAVKKGLEAAAATPAAAKVAGKVDSKVPNLDPKKMSTKDFDALPEEELKRLRGDNG